VIASAPGPWPQIAILRCRQRLAVAIFLFFLFARCPKFFFFFGGVESCPDNGRVTLVKEDAATSSTANRVSSAQGELGVIGVVVGDRQKPSTGFSEGAAACPPHALLLGQPRTSSHITCNPFTRPRA